MSIWFKFHRPGFVDVSDPPNEWVEYENEPDLMMHPTFSSWEGNEGFNGWAQDPDAGVIVALFLHGSTWWVVGSFRGELTLPRFEKPIKDLPQTVWVKRADFNFMPGYMLCGGEEYYPLGGFDDLYKIYDTLGDAQADAKEFLDKEEFTNDAWGWANIAHMTDEGVLEVWNWEDDQWKYSTAQIRNQNGS